MVTPPIARLGPAAIRGWLDDDYTKLAGYQVWTMFPMGRMAKSVFGPGNMVENPMRMIDNVTGFPFTRLKDVLGDEPTPETRAPGFRGLL